MVCDAVPATRPGPGREPPRRPAGVGGGGALPVLFLPSLFCTRRRAWRELISAVVKPLNRMVKGGSRPAQRLLPGVAGQ